MVNLSVARLLTLPSRVFRLLFVDQIVTQVFTHPRETWIGILAALLHNEVCPERSYFNRFFRPGNVPIFHRPVELILLRVPVCSIERVSHVLQGMSWCVHAAKQSTLLYLYDGDVLRLELGALKPEGYPVLVDWCVMLKVTREGAIDVGVVAQLLLGQILDHFWV